MKKLILIGLVSLSACSPAQRDWRTNTSIDLGVGGDGVDVKQTYPTVGMSYYLSGVSVSTGVWSDFYGNMGPYWAMGWSWMAFKKR